MNMRLRKKEKPLKRKIDLTEGSILKKLLIVAIPVLLTSFIQMTYNLTDMFWVGRVDFIGLDPIDAVAAVGTAGFYPWFGMGMIMIVKVGVSVYISQSAGRNDKEAVNRYATNGLMLMLFIALFYMIFGTFFNHIFVGFFDINNSTVENYAMDYLSIISMFGFALFTVNLFNGIYDGLGKTINTFYISATGLVLNMILDPVLILGFNMGVRGAAIATAASQLFVLLVYLVIYSSNKRPATISIKRYFSLETTKKIFTLGVPVGIQSMFMTTISIVVGIIVASYGASVMSISRIGSQIEALSWMIASGFQVALASFVGQNYGAYKIDRVKDGYIMSLKLLVPYGILVNTLLFVFAEPLFGIFIDEPTTLAGGAEYLRIISISQLFMILELTTAGAFNGLGKTIFPSTVGMIGNALRIPFALMASTAAGIWWTISLSSVFKGTVLFIIFIYYLAKIVRRHKEAIMVEKIEAI